MIRRPLPLTAALAICLMATASARAQAPAEDDINEALEKAIKASVAKVAPSVVQIETQGGTELISTGERGMQVRKGVGPTTGVIVSEDGFIISSAFNFANKPSAIFVTIPGRTAREPATVVATDHTRMLTLIRVKTDGKLPVPTAAPKKELQVGQTAVALGRTVINLDDKELKQSPVLSVGIVSALNRIWGKALQTDAKVSPTNYGGPLIDISGRVQGILVPASPRDENVLAGTDWYDSGIGFAIPLEDINGVLDRLKKGTDLRAGLLGITMQGDTFSPPVVSAIQPDSAAAKGGILAGDTIVAIDEKPVASQAQLKHQLGNKYDGDEISVTVKRGDKTEVLKNLRLSASLTSFTPPFLGILPLRDDPEMGVEVRYVFPKSPADAAGIKVGDRITTVQIPGMMKPQQFSGRDQFSAIVGKLPPGTEVKLEVQRAAGGQVDPIRVKLGVLTDEVPEKLPATASARKALEPRKGQNAPAPKKPEKKPETGLLKRATAARENEYYVYVPDDYDPNTSYSLVLWLHPVGKGKEKDMEAFRDAWEDYCSANHLIIVAPTTESEKGWQGTDTDFVSQAVRDTMAQYTIDTKRVVAHGMGVGGQMAYYLGFQSRDLFRGVATTGAVLASPAKDNIAGQPLSFYLVAGGKDPLAKEIADTKTRLLEKKYSVAHREIPAMGHQYLEIKTLAELVRWLDSLDRI